MVEEIDNYPRYKYTLVTDLQYVLNNYTVDTTSLESKNEGILQEHDVYYYWSKDVSGDIKKWALYIVEGREPMAYEDVIKNSIDENLGYNYYYKVSAVYFCCKAPVGSENDKLKPSDYQFFGWYSPICKTGEDEYIAINSNPSSQSSGILNDVATYYIPDAEFKLTPGVGDYKIIPRTDAGDNYECIVDEVEVNHFYYKGGYTNNDWLKQYVFHLTKSDQDANVNAQDVNLQNADAQDANVQNASAQDLNVQNANDQDVNVQDANVQNASAQDLNVQNANDQDVNVQELNVQNASAQDLNVQNANDQDVNVQNANVQNASTQELNVQNANAQDAFNKFKIQVDTLVNGKLYGEVVPIGAVNPAAAAAGFAGPEEVSAGFSDSAAMQEENADTPTAASDFSDGFESGTEETADAQPDKFSDSDTSEDTSEVSVPVSYAQEILGLETAAEEIVLSEETDGSTDTAVLAPEDTDAVDNTSAEQGENTSETDTVNTSAEQGENALETDTPDQNMQDTNALVTDTQIDNPDIGLQSDSTDEFTTDIEFTSGAEVFSAGAGATGESGTGIKLTDYDLIYVNGSISQEYAKVIVENKIPVIINRRVLDLDSVKDAFNSAIESASMLALRLKTEDADQHYVSQFIYVFKNTFEESSVSLLNLHFNTSINRQENDEDGFEEIIEYIKNENEYRKVEQSELTDGEKTLLNMNISQARAIEYILNYKYKRNVINKDTINVLEIQPAKNDDSVSEITAYDVYHWIYNNPPSSFQEILPSNITIKEKDVCSNNKNNNFKNKAMDNSSSTIWETNPGHKGPRQTDYDPNCHFIKLQLNEPSEMIGLTYVPRQDKKTKGIFRSFHLVIKNSSGTTLVDKYYSFKYSDEAYESKTILFGKKLQDVKFIEFTNIMSLAENGEASCAELKLLKDYDPSTTLPEVNITSMTSSEFVGNIQDLNTEYDMIFIGANGRTSITAYSADKGKESDTATLINGTGNMLYTHIGGAIKVDHPPKNKLDDTPVGLLDMDYQEDGKLITTGYSINGVGSFRGSGNDITQQQVDELIKFVKSGYPVIVDNNLWSGDSVNTTFVDNSSYMYVLLDSLNKLKGKYHNVCQRSDAEQTNKNFYANIPKPVIEFAKDKNGNITGMPVSAISTVEGQASSGRYIDGNELCYQFTIRDEAESSMVNAEYDCELFIDLNSDGNFSNAEKLDDIHIMDVKGNTLVKNTEGKYELKLNTEYILTRPLPEKYYKLITWKLKISNNSRDQIYTTKQGYCKQRADSKDLPSINVLQIYSKNKKNWVLTRDRNSDFYDTDFNEMLDKVEQNDFHISITTLLVKDYVDTYVKYYKDHEGANYLEQFDMLIIGFADMFDADGELVNTKPADNAMGAVDAINDFIYVKEKSVLFAHDTTSFRVNKTKQQWGTQLNKMRSILGMDRYGITSAEPGETLRKLIPNADLSVTNDLGIKIKNNAKGDVAYLPNSAQKNLAWQTQGFTNNKIMNNQLYAGNNNWQGVTTCTQVNNGAITEYPFKIPETIDVAGTHSQYYQLALEEDSDNDGLNDIIVWYCLGGSPYDTSPNDVRNNYYLYSKGNIMYTGVGHSNVKDAENNINEKRLFVNTIVAAYHASEVDPQVQFVSSFSRTAEKMKVDYYMLDHYFEDNVSKESRIVDNLKEICFTVDDYNLIASNKFSSGSRVMKLELCIDGVNVGVVDKNVPLYRNDENMSPIFANSDGTFDVSSGNVYKFNITDLEKYVTEKDASGNIIRYKDNVKISAKVTLNFEMHGRPVSGEGTSELTLKQRQLFDLD